MYEDLEYFIKRIDVCKNSFKKPSATKVGEHIPRGYSMTTIWTYDGIENQYDVQRGEGCMKQFREFSREHAIKIVNFEKKGNGTINKNKQKESYEKRKICYICKKNH